MLKRALLVIAAVALLGCGRMSPAEREVIGTWQEESADSEMQYSFTSDHKVSLCFLEDGPCDQQHLVQGTWRIRGDDVVYKLDWSPFAQKGEAPPVEEQTKPLARFRDRTSPKVPPYFRRVEKGI
jgi:hypothetical protein